MRTNHQWLLAARPEGMLKESDFRWIEATVADTGEGQVLVRTVYLSLDPTNRVWMNEADSYMPAIPLGEVMRGRAIGVVEESRHCDFQPGDLVTGLLGWQEYAVMPGRALNKLPKDLPVPLTAFLALLGHIGLTAYYGLLDVGAPKPGETLVVSTAAGAVGSLVGQIGKIQGCRVVGLAGTDEKCRWITNELGFDSAISYKTEDVSQALRQQCPEGIDIYFEQVGGHMLEAVLDQINLRARIVVCGMISTYNSGRPAPGPSNIVNVLAKRARIEGFLCMDYSNRTEEAYTALAGWYAAGKLKYRADVVEGLENAPRALRKMFEGSNIGKLMVHTAAEKLAVGGSS
jgi:NADPH-dependent curcumin reductase CurA